eukprot:scaffold19448_cov201-Skeletonema_marinoi.AAC.2
MHKTCTPGCCCMDGWSKGYGGSCTPPIKRSWPTLPLKIRDHDVVGWMDGRRPRLLIRKV